MFKKITFRKIKKSVINKKQKQSNFSGETRLSDNNNINLSNLENLTVS